MSYNVQRVVGDFFEDFVQNAFDLVRSGSNDLPDLMAKDGSYFVEVKAGSYNNCGVLKQNQLLRYNEEIKQKRFFAFCFHPLTGKLGAKYIDPAALRNALSLHSLYLLPFSLVWAHFSNANINDYPGGDHVVKMRLNNTTKIFNMDKAEWERLSLNRDDYQKTKPHKKVHLITRGGDLEKELLERFNLRKRKK
jgi:hypothetical protein